jgi:hypothetical protein
LPDAGADAVKWFWYLAALLVAPFAWLLTDETLDALLARARR